MFLSLFQKDQWGTLGFLQDISLNGYDYLLLAVCVLLVVVVDICKEKGIHIRERIDGWVFPARTAIYIAAILCIVLFGAYGPGYGAVDFIYAQF